MGPLVAALALPLAEIAAFILVGGWIGVWPVLGLVLAAMVGGVLLLRGEGAGAMLALRQAAQAGADPGPLLARGAMRVFAALLLIVPGFLTDALALALLLPVTQALILRRLRARFGTGTQQRGAAPGQVIDGTFEDLGPTDRSPTGQTRRPTHEPSGWTRH